MTFEENMNELKKIVEQLESGELPLEKSVDLYEQGKKLSEECARQLESAKLRIIEK